MKKRILALLLVLMLLLTACGGSKEEVSGTIRPIETEPVAMDQPEETEATAEEKPLSMGRLEGGNYINSYAGFGCSLDSSWTYYSAEELQDMPEEVLALFEGSELAESVDVATQFTDMKAENVDALLTMNVLYQKVPMEQRLALATIDEAEYMELTLRDKDMMIEAYAQAGFDVQTMETVSINFLGEERTALKTTSIVQDVPYYTLQLFYHNLGQFTITMTLASFVEDNTESMLDLFYAVE